MQEPTDLEPGDRELEAALGRLKPSPPRAPAHDLGYRLGLAAGRRRMRLWQAIASMAAAVAIMVALHQPEPRTVYVNIPAPPTGAATAQSFAIAAYPDTSDDATLPDSAAPYFRLEAQVLRFGIDALPDTPAPSYDQTSIPHAWKPSELPKPAPFESYFELFHNRGQS